VTKKTKCVPLRLTVCGAAGTGESFIINMIVSYMRLMFDYNDVVNDFASTWMTELNVLGEKLHMFAGLDWRNMKKETTNSTLEKLQKKLQKRLQ
jgi:hypothetical protein